MSPSNSSSPKADQRLNALVAAAEENMTMNNPKEGSLQEVVPELNNPQQVSPQEVVHDLNTPKQEFPQEVVPESTTSTVVSRRTNTERPSSDLRVFRPLNMLMKKNPSKENHALVCNFCKRGFPNANALSAHQKTHKDDILLEVKLEQVKPSYSPGQCFSNMPCNFNQGPAPGEGSSARSITSPPFNSSLYGFPAPPCGKTALDEVMGYPSAPPYGKTSYGFSLGAPLVTHNYNHNHPNPTLRDISRYGVSFGPFKHRTSGIPSFFNGGLNMAPPPQTPYPPFMVNPNYVSYPSRYALPPYYRNGPHVPTFVNSIAPPNTLGSSGNNSSSQGELSLELSLGPSNFTGGSNSDSNNSVNPSLHGGEIIDPNLPVRPVVSHYHYHGCNPLDSVTGNVPPPPPTTSPPNDENAPGSKEKNEVVVTGDHDMDQQEEVEAKT